MGNTARLVLLLTIFFPIVLWSQEGAETREEKVKAFKAAQVCYSESNASQDSKAKLECAKVSLDLGLELFGAKHKNTAALTYNYALALKKSGALEDSSVELQKTVKLYKTIYGAKSEELAGVLIDLAQVEHQLDTATGIRFYHQAIGIFGKLTNFNKVAYANILLKSSIAISGGGLLSRKDFNKILQYTKLASEIFVSTYGEDSPSASLAFFTLGKLRLIKRQYTQAIEPLEKSLADPSLGGYAHAFLVEAYLKTDQPLLAQKHLDALAEVGDIQQQDLQPVYVSTPKYPRLAHRRSIEGYAVVEVIITKQGGVRQPLIVEEWPKGEGFGEAALKAAEKLKYKPMVEQGKAVEVPGVRYKYTFKMAR